MDDIIKNWPYVAGGVVLGAVGASVGLGVFTDAKSGSAPAAAATGKIELKYWNGRGLMEVPRMLLALASKFPGAGYDDLRFGTEPKGSVLPYDSVKDSLGANLGRMPILSVGGQSVGQSAAINVYLGLELGLMGSSNMEAAQIVAIAEHLSEMNKAFRGILPYGTEPTEESDAKWFGAGATDCCGPANMKNKERFAKWYVGRIEKVVGGSPYAVGSEISLADVLIYNAFAEVLLDSEVPKLEFPQYRREPFGNKAKTDLLLESAPKIKAIIANVAGHPNISKWLSMRGVQGF